MTPLLSQLMARDRIATAVAVLVSLLSGVEQDLCKIKSIRRSKQAMPACCVLVAAVALQGVDGFLLFLATEIQILVGLPISRIIPTEIR